MITTQMLKEIRLDINRALESVAEKYGVAIKAGNASFSSTNAVFKLELSSVVGSEVITKEKAAFLEFANSLDIKKEALAQFFSFNGKMVKFIGYNPRSSKYPYIGVIDGKEYRLPSSFGAILRGYSPV